MQISPPYREGLSLRRDAEPLAVARRSGKPSERVVEYVEGISAEKAENDFLGRIMEPEEFHPGMQHDLAAALDGETEDAGADGRKSDALQSMFLGELQAVADGLLQFVVLLTLPKDRADRMNDMPGF